MKQFKSIRANFFYMKIRIANIDDLKILAPLFNSYRVFYEQESNLAISEKFLRNRISNNESIIFLAFSMGKAVGFSQLYPIFSSVSLEKYYVLNDLYVKKEDRRKGVGGALLAICQKFIEQNNLKGLSLETAIDNPAQKIYERKGWVSTNSEKLYYFWENSK